MSKKPVAAGKSSFDLIDQEKTLQLIDVKPGDNFLDLACGVGKYTLELAKKLGEEGAAYAIDLWPEGIEALEGAAKASQLENIKVILADITQKLPLDNESIDGCLLATILHDLAKPAQQAVMQEVARLLKPGGMLYVVEFKKIATGPGPGIDIRMDEEEVEELVAPCGFERVSVDEAGAYNYLVRYRKSM